MIPIEISMLFILVFVTLCFFLWRLRKKFVDPHIRQRFDLIQALSTQKSQPETHQYKLHWSFSLSWGLAWLVLAFFFFSSLPSGDSITMRVCSLLEGMGYGGVLIVLTLPFWIPLRKYRR